MTITQQQFKKAVGKTFKGFYFYPNNNITSSKNPCFLTDLYCVWADIFDSKGNITCYSIIGQHGAVSQDYLLECEKKSFKWVQENYPKLIEDIYFIYND